MIEKTINKIVWIFALASVLLLTPKTTDAKISNSEVSNTREGSVAGCHRYTSEFLFSNMIVTCGFCQNQFHQPKCRARNSDGSPKKNFYCNKDCKVSAKRRDGLGLVIEHKKTDGGWIIPLSKNKEAVVCECHYDLVKNYRWYYGVAGYAEITHLRMHRMILDVPKGMVVDHINRNKLDNRCFNLRICTARQNMQNRSVGSNNTSGCVGVQFHKQTQKWAAILSKGGRQIYFKTFDKKEDAIKDRMQREKELFGEFAPSNSIA